MTYQPDPGGPFVEVPTHLAHAWTAGGYTWEELCYADGIPPVVLSRLTARNAVYARSTVSVWPDLDVYEATTGRRHCRDGRTWLAPTDRLAAGVKLVTSRLSAGFTPGRRGR